MYSIMIAANDEILRNKLKHLPFFKENPLFQIVLETSNGKEALEYLRQNRTIDLVFASITMPIMNGTEFLESVNKEDIKVNVVLIGMQQDFSAAMACIRNGAFDYLVNPITNEQIQNVLIRLDATLKKHHPQKNQLLSQNEYITLRNLLLQSNMDFVNILENLFHKAEMNRSVTLIDMQVMFQTLFEHLFADLKKEYAFIELYYEKDDISIPAKYNRYSVEELYNTIQKVGNDMFQMVEHFKLDSSSELVQRIRQYLLRNVDKNISLKKIADLLYVNKTYLSHLFKMETGRTFMSYFTEIRMLRSRILLRNHYKVYECAFRLGYEDTEYFSRVFKNYYGYKPTEYMAQLDVLSNPMDCAACQQ